MRIFQNALLCAIVAAISAHIVYVRSNMFILGDAIRRGRHPLWDPVFFDGLALLAGLLIGAVCAALLFATNPGKAALAGIAITLASVGIVGGTTTFSRYRALPREPVITGAGAELEFELRMPTDRDSSTAPTRGEFDSDGRIVNKITLSPQAARAADGRIVIPGRARVLHAVSPRLLSIEVGDDVFANFMLPLAEQPTEADSVWTNWERQVNAAAETSDAQVFQMRYRVHLSPVKRN